MPLPSSLQNICPRCGEPTEVTLMSMFNLDILCPECQRIETQHPSYREAVKAEGDATNNGNFNFPGVGLPRGYMEWAANQTRRG